jgi:hypothetical protein
MLHASYHTDTFELEYLQTGAVVLNSLRSRGKNNLVLGRRTNERKRYILSKLVANAWN